MHTKYGVKLLFVLFCLIGLIKANCLNYGHSCWGAHGKRSALPVGIVNRQQKPLSGKFGFLQVFLGNEGEKFNKYNVPGVVLEPVMQSSDEDSSNDNEKPTRKFFLNKKPLSLDTLKKLHDASVNDNNESNEDNLNINNYNLLKMFNEDIQG